MKGRKKEGGRMEEEGGREKERGRRKEWDGSPGGAAEHWWYNSLASCTSHTAKSDNVKRRKGGREGERKGGGGWMVEGVGKGRKSEIRGEEEWTWYRP